MPSDSESLELFPEDYEGLKNYMKRRMENNMFESVRKCVYCNEAVNIMTLHSHMKKCMWWFEELYGYPHTHTYIPPAVIPPKVSNDESKQMKRKRPEQSSPESDDEEDWPFNEDNYQERALKRKKKGKSSKRRTCVVSSKNCNKVQDPPAGFYFYTGDTKYHICSQGHINSDEVKKEIVRTIGSNTSLKQSNQDQRYECALGSCKGKCGTTFQVGARDTEPNKRWNFCTFAHLWEHVTHIRTREWKDYVKSSKKEKATGAEEEIQDILNSANMVE